MDMKNIINVEHPKWYQGIVDPLNRFPIVLTSNEWISGTKLHYQPGLEIHITQEGKGTMAVGRQILLQNPRSVLVFRGVVPHQTISKSSYKRTVICANFDDQSNNLQGLHSLIDFTWIPNDSCLSFSLDLKQYQQLEELCVGLRRELGDREVGWGRMALAFVLQITAFLQRTSDPGSITTFPKNNSKNDLVQLCSDYVCRNLAEELTLKAVAKRFSVSGGYLTRSFTKEMSISFYQYVLLQRVAEGKRLLREAQDVSISEITHMIGFTSSSHFNRHFKALTEETPSSYRQQFIET